MSRNLLGLTNFPINMQNNGAIANSKVEDNAFAPKFNFQNFATAFFQKKMAPYIHSQYVCFFYPLEKIIGEQYVKIIQADEKSMNYATISV